MAKYESYKVGDSEFSFISFPLIAHRHAYTYADLPFTVPVDTGCIILGVGSEVTTAFSGGTPTISLGNGTTVDYWITTTLAAAGTPGFVQSFAVVSTGAVTGTVADKVVVTGSTQLSAGAGAVYVFMLDTNTNWRTSGQW